MAATPSCLIAVDEPLGFLPLHERMAREAF